MAHRKDCVCLGVVLGGRSPGTGITREKRAWIYRSSGWAGWGRKEKGLVRPGGIGVGVRVASHVQIRPQLDMYNIPSWPILTGVHALHIRQISEYGDGLQEPNVNKVSVIPRFRAVMPTLKKSRC